MSEQQVDHSANIIQMIGERDSKIHELSGTVVDLQGKVNDYASELAASAIRETQLRLKLRSQERQSDVELVRLETRTKELVEISNEQSRDSAALKADMDALRKQLQPADPLPFVLHLVAVQANAVFNSMVQAFVHIHVNQRQNQTTRDIHNLMAVESSCRYRSFEKTMARYCNIIRAERPSANDVRNAFPDFIRAEADIFCKDPMYSANCSALREIHSLSRNSWMYRKALDDFESFSWVEAFNASPEEFYSDKEYTEVYVNSLITIASALIGQNF